MICEANLLQ